LPLRQAAIETQTEVREVRREAGAELDALGCGGSGCGEASVGQPRLLGVRRLEDQQQAGRGREGHAFQSRQVCRGHGAALGKSRGYDDKLSTSLHAAQPPIAAAAAGRAGRRNRE